MRGTRIGVYGERHRVRIIPADAGNTRQCRLKPANDGDHPRGCGEHDPFSVTTLGYCGSSPRMRGTPLRYGIDIGENGIIPADAGNTTVRVKPKSLSEDHPRGCGEHG